jgi:hypothetical protein
LISASFILSIRAKSLLIDFLLTSVSLPHGDDARSFIARRVAITTSRPASRPKLRSRSSP